MAEENTEKETESAPAQKSQLWLYLAAGLAVIAAGLLAMYFLGSKTEQGEDAEGFKPYSGVYVALPDLLVNVGGDRKKTHFLKLCLSFEVKNHANAKTVNELVPQIIDRYQVYLRDLRVEDLMGAEGVFMLKQQLLERANAVTAPVEVLQVLFRDILVQ